ncbi:NADP-dependent phosphogluconate dehydrogenase, partial [Streptococcus pyogenes]
MGVPIPTIYAAVNARVMSAYKDERKAASLELPSPERVYRGDIKTFINQVRDALYCSKMCSYAQGMALLGKASAEYG